MKGIIYLNKCQQNKSAKETLKELSAFGMHIVDDLTPVINRNREKYLIPHNLLVYENQICELLKLIDCSEFKELWEVKFLNETETSHIFI